MSTDASDTRLILAAGTGETIVTTHHTDIPRLMIPHQYSLVEDKEHKQDLH